MTNIVTMTPRSRVLPQDARLGALLDAFCRHRRQGDDVFWLKENAELLNILECTGTVVPDAALAVFAPFYDMVEKRLQFFPQYYRFFLSMALDLEDLGMDGNKAQDMVDWACDSGLADAELSDLQRMEARRLMLRRGRDPLPRDAGLDDRLRAFIGRSATFAVPNKKAAYELAHVVFYLSEYGRRDPELGRDAVTSLHFAGLLAFIEQNADLLAEICIALTYAGEAEPAPWAAWLDRETHLFSVDSIEENGGLADDYHEFFVCNWYRALDGVPIFARPMSPRRMRFRRGTERPAPLREVSEAMLRLGGARSADWGAMRARIESDVSPHTLDVIDVASQSSSHFGRFFEGFARAGKS